MPIEWVPNKYGSGSRASLSPILVISVGRNIGMHSGLPPKWRIAVFGAGLKVEFDTQDEAKCVAERLARKHLALALAAITAE